MCMLIIPRQNNQWGCLTPLLESPAKSRVRPVGGGTFRSLVLERKPLQVRLGLPSAEKLGLYESYRDPRPHLDLFR